MRNSLFMPTFRYVSFGNVFRNKVSRHTFRQYHIQRVTNSASNNVIFKNNTNKFQRSTGLYHGFGYSSVNYSWIPGKRTQLMDFRVVLGPSMINVIQVLIEQFIVKRYDREFNLYEFLTNSKTAMEVVTTLISESRFSELKGLLTEECREEVMKNVTAMDQGERLSLVMKADDVTEHTPISINVTRVAGENNTQRIFAEIFVAYSAIKDLKNVNFQNMLIPPDVNKCIAYNAKFIRELTPNVEDQWTINAINVFKYSEYMTYSL